jgi:hypothetical protein
MNDDIQEAITLADEPARSIKPWYRQPILGLVVGSVVLALITTSISLYMYNTSETALLDLSRPGYEEARADLDPVDNLSFSADGTITSETLESFDKLYQKQLNKTKTNPYSSEALSNASLNLSDIPE